MVHALYRLSPGVRSQSHRHRHVPRRDDLDTERKQPSWKWTNVHSIDQLIKFDIHLVSKLYLLSLFGERWQITLVIELFRDGPYEITARFQVKKAEHAPVVGLGSGGDLQRT